MLCLHFDLNKKNDEFYLEITQNAFQSLKFYFLAYFKLGYWSHPFSSSLQKKIYLKILDKNKWTKFVEKKNSNSFMQEATIFL